MFTFQQWLAGFLVKAAGHKYIKRIPYQSGGKLRYRYIYNVTHTHAGKHVLDPDHMKVGTKLMLDATSGKEVHGHITDVRGDLVSFEYDDGPRKGEVVTTNKERLAAELDKVHGISDKLSTARAKQKAVVAKLKERGASDKQIAREQKRLDALGGEADGPSTLSSMMMKEISALSVADFSPAAWFPEGAPAEGDPRKAWYDRLAEMQDRVGEALTRYKSVMEKQVGLIDRLDLDQYAKDLKEHLSAKNKELAQYTKVIEERAEIVQAVAKEQGVIYDSDRRIYTGAFKTAVNKALKERGHAPVATKQHLLSQYIDITPTQAGLDQYRYLPNPKTPVAFTQWERDFSPFSRENRASLSGKPKNVEETVQRDGDSIPPDAYIMANFAQKAYRVSWSKISMAMLDDPNYRAGVVKSKPSEYIVSVSSFGVNTSTAHELTHVVEDLLPTGANDLITCFLVQRAQSKDLQDLYGDGKEWGFAPKEGTADYTMKIYPKNPFDTHFNSEVLTTGVEYFADYRSTSEFAAKDPAHFAITSLFLQGDLK